MLDIALKNIFSKRTRSMLCIIGVMICVFLIGTMEGLSNRLLGEIEGEVANLNEKMYFQQKGTGYPPIGSNINLSMSEQVLSRNDIDPDQSMNILFVAIEPGERPTDPPKVLGVGLEPGKERLFTGNAISPSRFQYTRQLNQTTPQLPPQSPSSLSPLPKSFSFQSISVF